MAERKPLMLRLDPATLDALRAWATDDLRSLNGQIEFLLRRALRETGRLPAPAGTREASTSAEEQRSTSGSERSGGPRAERRRPGREDGVEAGVER